MLNAQKINEKLKFNIGSLRDIEMKIKQIECKKEFLYNKTFNSLLKVKNKSKNLNKNKNTLSKNNKFLISKNIKSQSSSDFHPYSTCNFSESQTKLKVYYILNYHILFYSIILVLFYLNINFILILLFLIYYTGKNIKQCLRQDR